MDERDLFNQIVDDVEISDVVVTNYIVIYEVANFAGKGIRVEVSDGMSPWLADGMMSHAQDILDMYATNGDTTESSDTEL